MQVDGDVECTPELRGVAKGYGVAMSALKSPGPDALPVCVAQDDSPVLVDRPTPVNYNLCPRRARSATPAPLHSGTQPREKQARGPTLSPPVEAADDVAPENDHPNSPDKVTVRAMRKPAPAKARELSPTESSIRETLRRSTRKPTRSAMLADFETF